MCNKPLWPLPQRETLSRSSRVFMNVLEKVVCAYKPERLMSHERNVSQHMDLILQWQIYEWINDKLVTGDMDEKICSREDWEGSLFSGALLRKTFRRRQHWKSTLNIHSKDWDWSFDILANWCEELTLWKILWCWERLRVRREGDHKGWDGWMASPTQWTQIWDSEGQGSLVCCSPWGRKELATT